MSTPKRPFCTLLALLLSLVSNLRAQTLSADEVILHRDLVYAKVDGKRLTLDLAVPKNLSTKTPAIVDIPGGAWRICNKSAADAILYARHGYVGVSLTHRTSDVAVFPAAVHDCKTAIRWLRAHAETYHIDPERIGVTGMSSGGHLAVLLGTSAGDSYLEGDGGYGRFSSAVQAVVDHFGPIDFLQMNDTTGLGLANYNDDSLDNPQSPPALFLGGPLAEKGKEARLANPLTYLDSEDPPTLIMHGEKDGMVIIRQSELLYDALKRSGVPTDFVRVKNADHMYRPYRWDVEIQPSADELNQAVMAWFETHLGKPAPVQSTAATDQPPSRQPEGSGPPLYYRLTVDLPGKTDDSYIRGRYALYHQGQVLTQGRLEMTHLSTEEGRRFQADLMLPGLDLSGQEILWNFRGEIYDGQLKKKFEPMYMQGTTYDEGIEGIGFHMTVEETGAFKIEKRVFRK